jgi:hypothetical protein
MVALVRETGLDKGALDRIRFWVNFAEKSLALDLQPLASADELLPINQSLALRLINGAASFANGPRIRLAIRSMAWRQTWPTLHPDFQLMLAQTMGACRLSPTE